MSFPVESRSRERRRGVRCGVGGRNGEHGDAAHPRGADSSVGTSGRERRRRLGVAGLPARRRGNGKSPRAPHTETRWRGRLPGAAGWGRTASEGPGSPAGQSVRDRARAKAKTRLRGRTPLSGCGAGKGSSAPKSVAVGAPGAFCRGRVVPAVGRLGPAVARQAGSAGGPSDARALRAAWLARCPGTLTVAGRERWGRERWAGGAGGAGARVGLGGGGQRRRRLGRAPRAAGRAASIMGCLAGRWLPATIMGCLPGRGGGRPLWDVRPGCDYYGMFGGGVTTGGGCPLPRPQ